ncbi:MAG: helix-turn-helix transcriptional regulator [Nitrospinae bacterium]|nr:helix-turn-helix transcriptional regulator [Nitrospinota bacterium]
MLEPIKKYVDSMTSPTFIFGPDSAVVHSNSSMRDLISHHQQSNLNCFFARNGIGASCRELCPKHRVTSGKCFLPNELPTAHLVMMVRLAHVNHISVGFYSTDTNLHPEIHRAASRLLEISGSRSLYAESTIEIGVGSQNDCEGMFHARDVVVAAARQAGFDIGTMENSASPVWGMDVESALAAKRVIATVFSELGLLYRNSRVSVTEYTGPVANGAGARHLSIQLECGKASPKSLEARIATVQMRAGSFCHLLGEVLGLSIHPPVIFSNNSRIEARIELPYKYPLLENAHSLPQNAMLTSREGQIVEMLLAGWGNSQIAASLKITQATVKQHLKSIYRKSGVKSRVGLIFKLRK